MFLADCPVVLAAVFVDEPAVLPDDFEELLLLVD
jgi:hypothetical protein